MPENRRLRRVLSPDSLAGDFCVCVPVERLARLAGNRTRLTVLSSFNLDGSVSQENPPTPLPSPRARTPWIVVSSPDHVVRKPRRARVETPNFMADPAVLDPGCFFLPLLLFDFASPHTRPCLGSGEIKGKGPKKGDGGKGGIRRWPCLEMASSSSSWRNERGDNGLLQAPLDGPRRYGVGRGAYTTYIQYCTCTHRCVLYVLMYIHAARPC